MTNDEREALIEKAAKAILERSWGLGTMESARADAEVAFAVFEQAYTPTDDEREAEQQALCWECIENPDPNRENESSGYCPTLCENCGGCAYCDGSC